LRGCEYASLENEVCLIGWSMDHRSIPIALSTISDLAPCMQAAMLIMVNVAKPLLGGSLDQDVLCRPSTRNSSDFRIAIAVYCANRVISFDRPAMQ
jgi:hypothetical protein